MKTAFKSVIAGLLLASVALPPVYGQEEGLPGRGAPDNTPLPELNVNAIIKSFNLIETKEPARVFIKGWRKPKKIIVNLDNNTHRLAWLKEVVPADVQLVGIVGRGGNDYLNELKDADGVMGGCRRDSFAGVGPNFHWLHNTGVGIDQCFTGGIVPANLRGGNVAISNSARLEGNTVSAHGIALMMALSRGLDQYVMQDKTKKFTTETYPRMWTLTGRTIVIAGYGGVGSGMATLAHGLGMRVMVTNAVIPDNVPDWIEKIGLPGELPAMVANADVVMTALPLTAETTGLFNAALIAKFKKGAMFINVTRGEEQVDADVAAALKSGQISSAGFDLIPDNSPLYDAPHVIITPHVAAQNVDDSQGRGGEQIWAIARENLRRFVNGDKMLSVIDPVKGY